MGSQQKHVVVQGLVSFVRVIKKNMKVHLNSEIIKVRVVKR